MIPSTLLALVTALSSFAAVNGAVIQRDGTFTYLTPQPTAPGQAASPTTATTSSQSSSTATTRSQSTTSTSFSGTGATTTQSSSTASTQSTTSSTTFGGTGPTTTQSSSTASTQSTTSTSFGGTGTTTTQSSSVTSTRSTTPTSTSTTTSVTAVPPITTSATTKQSSSPTSPASTTPTSITKTTTPTVTSPTATPTSPAGTANCNGVQQWQASFAYTAGDQVIFNGQLFTARQWTYNNAPPAHADQWTASGTCAQPVNNQANCKGVPAWQSTVAYTAGNQVTFNGHLWSAVQWAESNTPGDTSGSWKDQGTCA